MGLLDLRPDAETSRDDLRILLAAIVRAYGTQETSGKASRMIVDEHELASAFEIVNRGRLAVYMLEPGVSIRHDDVIREPMVKRYVIEVME